MMTVKKSGETRIVRVLVNFEQFLSYHCELVL